MGLLVIATKWEVRSCAASRACTPRSYGSRKVVAGEDRFAAEVGRSLHCNNPDFHLSSGQSRWGRDLRLVHLRWQNPSPTVSDSI